MVARGDLRHDPAVNSVQVYLAVQGLTEQALLGAIKSDAGLVAAGFYAEDDHRRQIIPWECALARDFGQNRAPGHAPTARIRVLRETAPRAKIAGSFPVSPGIYFALREGLIQMPSVRLKENEYFDAALRRFKRACEKAGVLTELRRREYYEKPTQERKRKKAAAVKRHLKRLSREDAKRKRLY